MLFDHNRELSAARTDKCQIAGYHDLHSYSSVLADHPICYRDDPVLAYIKISPDSMTLSSEFFATIDISRYSQLGAFLQQDTKRP